MGKIVIFKGNFIYGVVNRFEEDLGKAFKQLGKEVAFIDLTSDPETIIKRHQEEFSSECEFILAFSGIRSGLQIDGKSFYDTLNCPFVSVLIDPPFYHYDRFSLKKQIVTCLDKTHLELMNKLPGTPRSVHFLPHGGCQSPHGIKLDGKRPIKILFSGTAPDLNKDFGIINSMLDDFKKLTTNSIDLYLAEDSLDMGDAFEKVASELKIELTDENGKIPIKYLQCIFIADTYVRGVARLNILDSLDKAGIPVNIYGQNWQNDMFKNHRVSPPKNFNEMLFLMSNSEIVLNIALFVHGSHERVFSAMLNGAVSVSDYSLYYQEIFTEDKDIVMYRKTRIDELPAKVNALLEDRDNLKQIAANGYRKATANHTWAQRAESILEMVKNLK
jgi:glycosyltransferase involved in cell wall biosynthesis